MHRQEVMREKSEIRYRKDQVDWVDRSNQKKSTNKEDESEKSARLLKGSWESKQDTKEKFVLIIKKRKKGYIKKEDFCPALDIRIKDRSERLGGVSNGTSDKQKRSEIVCFSSRACSGGARDLWVSTWRWEALRPRYRSFRRIRRRRQNHWTLLWQFW